jgi:hypothetical protein
MPKPIRRVVTGHDANGKSIFIMDGPAPAVHDRGPGLTCVVELWQTTETPADNSGNEESIGPVSRLPPPPNGSIFRVVEYPPDQERIAVLQGQSQHFDSSAEGYKRHYGARHPGFHKTDTIDYAIVVEGEIYALMDEGELLLKTGDVLVQRGTSHAWSNRTDKTARVLFVLIDAKPV